MSRVRGDFSIAQADDAAHLVGEFAVMRRNDESDVIALGEVKEQSEQTRGGFTVEIAGRLITEKKTGAIRERARDGDALLFAARKLARAMIQAMLQSHFCEQFRRAFFGSFAVVAAIHERGHQHIFERGEFRKEMMKLENESDFAIA